MVLKKLFNKEKLKGMLIGSVITVLAISPLLIFAGSEAITAYLTDIKVMYNGKLVISDTKPIVYNGRTMLGVRALADAFGKNIEWNGDTSTVVITDKVKMVEDVLPTKDIDDSKKSEVKVSPQDLFVKYMEQFLSDKRYNQPVKLSNGKWIATMYEADKEYSYDIQNTNSIVSPYKAEVEFKTWRYETKEYNTKQEAAKDTNYNIISEEDGKTIIDTFAIYRYVYLYQNGQWVFNSAKYKSNLTGKWFDLHDVSEEHAFTLTPSEKT